MKINSFQKRWVSGTRWSWQNERYRNQLPADLDQTVMQWRSDDRLHRKQGRSTCRVRIDGPSGPLILYLKRHEKLPWSNCLAALVFPEGRHSPAGTEWQNLQQVRSLGISVPEAIAVGEQIGPGCYLQSYLLIKELSGHLPLHELVPLASRTWGPEQFESWKRRLIIAMAQLVAQLHDAWLFHKDLYLCHFFLPTPPEDEPSGSLHLIDLHRLGHHRLTAPWWRWKDLGQLLFSSFDVPGIANRDRLRFWKHYRRMVGLNGPRWQARWVRLRAARYDAHDRRHRLSENMGPDMAQNAQYPVQVEDH